MTGGRLKGEYFPDSISGLSRCSRTEIHDDIEFIQANLPLQQQHQQLQQQLQQQQTEEAALQQENGVGIDDGVDDGAGGGVGGVESVSSSSISTRGLQLSKREKRKMNRAEKFEQELSVQDTWEERRGSEVAVRPSRVSLLACGLGLFDWNGKLANFEFGHPPSNCIATQLATCRLLVTHVL